MIVTIFRRIRGAAAALAVVGLMLATPLLAQNTNEATVTIDNFAFTPETLTVKPGTKVTFINHDDIPHSVVAVEKAFRSRALDTDEKYEFTFEKAGDFAYFCGLHPHMKGKIVVTP